MSNLALSLDRNWLKMSIPFSPCSAPEARISSWTSFAAAITSGSSGVSFATLVLADRRDSAGAADLVLPVAARLLRVAMACASAVYGSGISRNSPQLKSGITSAQCIRSGSLYVKLRV